MAEQAERAVDRARQHESGPELSALRHEALDRRAATLPMTGYAALLDNRSVIQRARSKADADAEMQRGLAEYKEDLEADDDFEAEDDEEEEEDIPLMAQLTSMSCGIAAVQTMMAARGKTVSHAQLVALSQQYEGAYNPSSGTAMENMAEILKALGVKCSAPVTLPLFKVVEKLAKGPVIARVMGASGHFVVIHSVSGDPPERNHLGAITKEGTRRFQISDPWPPGQGARLEVGEQEFQTGGGSLQTTALYIHLT
jgi:hypothetical protein